MKFIASRSDGLGNRLIAIVNAIVLARLYHCDFIFNWPEDKIHTLSYHDVVKKDLIFEKMFLDSYHVDCICEGAYSLSIDDLVHNKIQDSDCYLVGVCDLSVIGVTPKMYKSAFDFIDFSELIDEIFYKVESIEFNKIPIALHARGGDIIYGNYRFNSRFTKMIIPFPIVMLFNESLKKNESFVEFEVLFFGQDASLVQYWGGLGYKVDMQDEEVSYLKAFYEFKLMSRCNKVFAGSSAFARLSSIVGGSEILSADEWILKYVDKFGCTNLVNSYFSLIEALKGKVDSLQLSFVYWAGYFYLKDFLSGSEKILFLSNACLYDRDNDFYKVVFSSVLCEQGYFFWSEAVLESCNGRSVPGSLWRVCSLSPDGISLVSDYKDGLAISASKGMYMANLTLGIVAYHEENISEVSRVVTLLYQIDKYRKSANLKRLVDFINCNDTDLLA